MNTKQKWLLERLLIPAGILPPAIKYDDLRFNEQNRQQIGNVGFEYMLLLNQNPNLVSSSAIGKKIFAVHAPFSEFGASLAGKNKYTKKLATKLLYGNNKITDNFYKMSALTFQFAKNVGAKNITFHIGQLDHSNLKKSLKFGIIELTRQRIRSSIRDVLFGECKFCQGTGYTKTIESLCLN